MLDNTEEKKILGMVLKFGAWGYVLVIFSCLFLYAGHWLDKTLNTVPIFMIGLFLLAVLLCVIMLYREASKVCHDTEEEEGE